MVNFACNKEVAGSSTDRTIPDMFPWTRNLIHIAEVLVSFRNGLESVETSLRLVSQLGINWYEVKCH